MMRYRRQVIPDNPSGAPLDVRLEIVAPEATTNLFTNPSWERDTSGWTNSNDGSGGTPYTRATTYQFRGAYAAVLTIRTGGTYGQIVGPSISNATQYSMQFHVRRPNRAVVQSSQVKAYVNGGTADFDRIVYVANGWYRCEKTWTSSSTSGVGIRVIGSPGAVFYVDGAQLEAKGYCTTYCDGDQAGLLPVEVPPPFAWTGTPHASTSTRTAQTRAGGRPLDVSRYGLSILGLVGFGFSPRNVISTPLGLADGSLYQRTIREARAFTIAAAFGPSDPRTLSARRGALRSLLSHDLSGLDQPVVMRLQRFNGCDAMGDQVTIAASYLEGLQEEISQPFDEKVSIQFEAYIPGLLSAADRGSSLDVSETTASINYLASRTDNGAWGVLGSGLNAQVQRNAILFGPDGKLYVGGNFTSPGTRVARYNFESAAWETLSTGLGAQVNALCFAPDGTLYAGLNSSVTIGTTGSVVQWNGSAWSMVTGAPTDQINALAYDGLNGRLYTGGASGGNATLRYFTSGSWTAVSTGTAGAIRTLRFSPGAAKLFIGGSFTNLGGVSNATNVASYALGGPITALSTGANAELWGITLDDAGNVYVTGDFSTIGGLSADGWAMWNGVAWSLIPNVIDRDGTIDNEVPLFYDTFRKQLYVNRLVTNQLPTATGSGPYAVYPSGSVPRSIGLFSGLSAVAMTANADRIILANTFTGAVNTAGLTTVSNPGTVPTPWRMTILNSGGSTNNMLQVDNLTLGGAIIFAYAPIYANERIIIDVTPYQVQVFSDQRGDLIAQGGVISVPAPSSLLLKKGDNTIQVYPASGANMSAFISFTPYYESLDDATMTPVI